MERGRGGAARRSAGRAAVRSAASSPCPPAPPGRFGFWAPGSTRSRRAGGRRRGRLGVFSPLLRPEAAGVPESRRRLLPPQGAEKTVSRTSGRRAGASSFRSLLSPRLASPQRFPHEPARAEERQAGWRTGKLGGDAPRRRFSQSAAPGHVASVSPAREHAPFARRPRPSASSPGRLPLGGLEAGRQTGRLAGGQDAPRWHLGQSTAPGDIAS